MRKLLLCLVASGLCLPLSSSPSPAITLTPTCIGYCCVQDPAKANVVCYYNGGYKTCSWFWVPGRSACL